MKSFTDISVDLETYGKEPGCVILEVAFVAFDRRNPDRKTVGVSVFPDIAEQVNMGMKIDHDTLAWWANNNPAAWKRQMDAMRYPVDECIHMLTFFVRNHCNADTVLAWAKGSHFDFPILRTMMPDPWHFRNIHDLRTLALAFPYQAESMDDRDEAKYPRHHGLEDAMYQAMEIQHLCSMIATVE